MVLLLNVILLFLSMSLFHLLLAAGICSHVVVAFVIVIVASMSLVCFPDTANARHVMSLLTQLLVMLCNIGR